jgi:[histone H3]-lysine36 N-trimethyltransferase
MADTGDEAEMKQENLEMEVRDMQLKEEQAAEVDMDTIPVADSVKQDRSTSVSQSGPNTPKPKRQSQSPIKAEPSEAMPDSPFIKEDEATIGGDVELKLESGDRPKLVRKQSQKVKARPPQLFNDYEDKTAEAKSTFGVIPECAYANKHMGETDPALECECQEEWGEYQPLTRRYL